MSASERNSVVEYELPKLDMWVRFPSLAPNFASQNLILRLRRIGAAEGPKLIFIFIVLAMLAGCKTVETPYRADTASIGGVYHYGKKNFFTWPLKGTVVSFYGSKLDMTRNKGIDIRAEEGSSVRASRAGKVVFCDEWLKGFGKTVILDHGDSFQTIYAYNSLIMVNVGDVVEQNAVIAKVGRGGRAKEPSLHFEIRRDGEPQNPYYYLSR